MTTRRRCRYCGHILRPPSKKARSILSRSIDSHEWSTRTLNVFRNYYDSEWDSETKKTIYQDSPIKTFGDLCAVSRAELLRKPNFGKKSLAEVEEVLESYGLQLTTVDGYGDGEIRTNPCLERQFTSKNGRANT